MNHNCREKMRVEQLRSPIGQSAYAHYCEWMRLQRHSIPPIDTFAESRLYTTFIKFAEYAKKTRLPNPPAFIKLMVENNKVSPALWSRDNTYAMYMKVYDTAVPPQEQFMGTYDELAGLAVDHGVELVGVFEALGAVALAELIGRRKLSPWFLIPSTAFKSYLLALPEPEKSYLSDALNVPSALERFKQEPYLLKEFAAALKEFGL